jgi:hypothetical protein
MSSRGEADRLEDLGRVHEAHLARERQKLSERRRAWCRDGERQRIVAYVRLTSVTASRAGILPPSSFSAVVGRSLRTVGRRVRSVRAQEFEDTRRGRG